MALFHVVVSRWSSTKIRRVTAPDVARIGDSARRSWCQLSRWRRVATSIFALPRPALDVQSVVAQLESVVAVDDTVSRLERVVAGVLALEPARSA
jgi:hypothetical protein